MGETKYARRLRESLALADETSEDPILLVMLDAASG